MSVPVPFVEALVREKIVAQVNSQFSCPGIAAPSPQVAVGGGHLLRQALDQKLEVLRVTVPNTAIGGAQKATFEATLRGVTQPTPEKTKVENLDASITLGFDDIPVPPDRGPRPTFGRTDDGALSVATETPASASSRVRATVFLKLAVRKESVTATPQKLQIFGRSIPAGTVSDLVGGVRTQPLPDLPDGLAYRSITPQSDGLHVALDGVVTEPLTALPTSVGGRPVSYIAQNGQLGISTAFKIPPIVDIPLTIFTEPRLSGRTLTLVPQSVTVLRRNRPTSDPLAKLVLAQVKQADLTRALPALPSGVAYRSVSVSPAGVQVAVGGVTVRPFSDLPAENNGQKTSYGAQNGMLTASTLGTPGAKGATPIVLISNPRIADGKLDLAPKRIRVFGTEFPAHDVLSQILGQSTVVPLQKLPSGLSYTGVKVLPQGLRITVTGRNVDLAKGLPGGSGCRS
jgi:hypothetical protein